MKQSRFTDEQIIGFLKQADAGMGSTYTGSSPQCSNICRALGERQN